MNQERVTPPDRIDASVVIAARDAAATLGEQLEALVAQAPTGRWEVIVVDNGSTDATAAVAEGYAARLPVRVVDAADRAGIAYARNAGARAAEGSLLLFVDADDRVTPGWLTAMLAAAQSSDSLGGNIAWFQRDDPGHEVVVKEPYDEHPLHGFAFLPSISGGNCGMRADVFWALGGWNEAYDGIAGEDVELFWRAHLAGHPAAFVRDAVLMCRVRSGLRRLLRQSYRDGKAHPRLYRDFRDAGMPPSPTAAAMRDWLRLIVRAPLMCRSAAGRRRWVTQIGHRAGRLAGSVRFRVSFL